MKILVYDPGGTTGWAECEATDKVLTVTNTGTFTDYLTYGKQITPYHLVVYEVVRANTLGFNPAGILSTGALLYVAHLNNVVLIPQYPHCLAGPRKWLKGMGFKRKTDHEYDSVAHALFYAYSNKLEFEIKL